MEHTGNGVKTEGLKMEGLETEGLKTDAVPQGRPTEESETGHFRFDNAEVRRRDRLLLEKYAPGECETGLHYAERSFARTEILRLEILAVSAKGKRVK